MVKKRKTPKRKVKATRTRKVIRAVKNAGKNAAKAGRRTLTRARRIIT